MTTRDREKRGEKPVHKDHLNDGPVSPCVDFFVLRASKKVLDDLKEKGYKIDRLELGKALKGEFPVKQHQDGKSIDITSYQELNVFAMAAFNAMYE